MNKKTKKSTKRKLDKFYTNDQAVDQVLLFLKKEILEKIESDYLNDIYFLEPCAGGGAFLDGIYRIFNTKDFFAYDIEPEDKRILKEDFLKKEPQYYKNMITIGNPPFGHRGKLAIDFINKSSAWSDIIVFVLPIQFERYNTQKQINNDLKLIHSSKPFKKNSFNFNGKPFNVNCIFQVWVNKERKEFENFNNLRLLKPLPNKHPDFDLFIHNNTEQTKKYFNKEYYKWDFAVVRQGYYDYTKKIYNPKNLRENVQYLFIKYKKPISKKIFDRINFAKLAEKNTSVKGFSNTDLVKVYSEIKQKEFNDA